MWSGIRRATALVVLTIDGILLKNRCVLPGSYDLVLRSAKNEPPKKSNREPAGWGIEAFAQHDNVPFGNSFEITVTFGGRVFSLGQTA